MKKIVGSVLLLAIALTIVFPVIAFASSSAPMTAKEMSAAIGGQKIGLCEFIGEGVESICRGVGGGWLTCVFVSVGAYLGCSFFF